jgi:tricarballylate dehydrogenase
MGAYVLKAGVKMKKFETDLVVIGCGAAGLSCALSALENGMNVINLERSPREDMGGNTRWTEANLLLKTGAEQKEFEIADQFLDFYGLFSSFHTDPDIIAETTKDYDSWSMLAKTTPFLDPEVLGTFADSVSGTLDWISDKGVVIETNPHTIPFCIDTLPYARIYGGGLAIVETLTPKIEELGGKLIFDTTARDLIEEDGQVIGVRCSGKNNECIEVYGKVVLASGGFEGNPQMLVQYGGQENRYLRPVAKGSHYNKGEGLRMALDMNAATAGDWSDCHHQVIDPRSPMPEAMVNIWPFAIMVNQEGKRFMDESPSNPMLWQEYPGEQILKQPGGISYIIYDEKLASDTTSNWKYGIRSEIPPVKANTLNELAALLMIPAEQLTQTVEEYNAACVNVDKVDYTKGSAETMEFDGAGTENLSPPKQNYANTVDQGPYYAYPAISSICFTYGGLRVNGQAQVINASGEVIPGLYAAGETVGMHYGIYTIGTSVLRGLCFGRIAGLHAANNATR